MAEIEAPFALRRLVAGNPIQRRADGPLTGNGAELLVPLAALGKPVACAARAEIVAQAMPHADAAAAGGSGQVAEAGAAQAA